MKKLFFAIGLFLTFSLQSFAQPKPYQLLTPKDSVLMYVQENGTKVIQHPVKPKQTIFALCQYYSISLEELYTHNPKYRMNPVLELGERVIIPVPNKAIRRYKGKNFVAKNYAPLYYQVQEGETLYHIAKRHFEMPVDSVKSRNKMKTDSVWPGQLLFMGWIGIQGVPKDWRSAHSEPTMSSTQTVDNKELLAEDGVAVWQKNSNAKGDLYALHNKAPLNSIITIVNPVTNKTIYAKVIGRIPKTYPKNTQIVISYSVGEQLGAKDASFYVKTKYFSK